MMRLVTGAKGLIGSNFEGDIKLKCAGRHNLTSWIQVDHIFHNKKVDTVIHCAAKVGGIGSNINANADYFRENVLINTHIIEACRIHKVKNLITFLSTCIFPESIDFPYTPEKLHLGPPHKSNEGYAYSKRMMETQIRLYNEQYDTNYKSVVPCNVYGNNDNFSLTHGHVIPMLIHKCFLAQRNETDLIIWGDGSPLREFIYVKDVIFLTEQVLEKYRGNLPVILSPSEEIKIKDLVDLIVSLFNFKGKVIFDKTKPNGQYRKPSDNNIIRELVPDFKFTPIEEGLKNTIEWFIDNYENIRK